MLNSVNSADVSSSANRFFNSDGSFVWMEIVDYTNEFIKVATSDQINKFFFEIVRECRGFEVCDEDAHIVIKALHDSGATCPEHVTVNDFSFYHSIEERQVIEQLCFDGKSMDWPAAAEKFVGEVGIFNAEEIAKDLGIIPN